MKGNPPEKRICNFVLHPALLLFKQNQFQCKIKINVVTNTRSILFLYTQQSKALEKVMIIGILHSIKAVFH